MSETKKDLKYGLSMFLIFHATLLHINTLIKTGTVEKTGDEMWLIPSPFYASQSSNKTTMFLHHLHICRIMFNNALLEKDQFVVIINVKVSHLLDIIQVDQIPENVWA